MTAEYKPLDYKPLFFDGGDTKFVPLGCSHPPTVVLSGSGWSVSASKEADVRKANLDKYNLILNLTGFPLSKKHRIPVPALSRYGASRPREIVLDWPDMQAINLPRKFWDDFMRCTSRWGWKVVVFCIGGHGRTGTALACMLVAKGWGPQESIDFVRREHCEKAIETESQERYIYRMAGVPFPVQVAKPKKKAQPMVEVMGEKDVAAVECCRCGHLNYPPTPDSKYNCKCCAHELCILCIP